MLLCSAKGQLAIRLFSLTDTVAVEFQGDPGGDDAEALDEPVQDSRAPPPPRGEQQQQQLDSPIRHFLVELSYPLLF